MVWIDEAEIEVGDSLFDRIATGIGTMKYLGVILSPASTKSRWVQREVEIALSKEIHGGKVVVLPILYKRCQIPAFLQSKLYADFSSPGRFQLGLGLLLSRLLYWLRVIPTVEPKQRLSTQAVKEKALQLGVVPLVRPAQSIGFVRGEDGGGFFPVQETDTVNWLAYVFNTGEVWVVDAWLSQIPQYLELDERIFSVTLQQCAEFLGRVGINGPYKWIA